MIKNLNNGHVPTQNWIIAVGTLLIGVAVMIWG